MNPDLHTDLKCLARARLSDQLTLPVSQQAARNLFRSFFLSLWGEVNTGLHPDPLSTSRLLKQDCTHFSLPQCDWAA